MSSRDAAPKCRTSPSSHQGTGDYQILSSGVSRSYSLTVPEVAEQERFPVVFNFHGATGNRKAQEQSSGMAALGLEEAFITVTPDAVGTIWNLDPTGPDVLFVAQLLDEVENKFCVNPAHIYATGFSMGGMLALVLGCHLPERFAAIAVVSGMVAFGPCPSGRVAPLLAIHGTEDEVVGFDGTMGEGVAFLIGYSVGEEVPELVEEWANRAGCGEALEVRREPNAKVAETRFSCPAQVQVSLLAIEGGDHRWPGSQGPRLSSGNTEAEFETSLAIWDFFSDQSLDERSSLR